MTQSAHQTKEGTPVPRAGTLFGTIVCRAIVPAWLFTGAVVKLFDGTPALLPKPVRAIYAWIANLVGMGAESELERFFDMSLRATISMEFTLVGAMILLASWSRAIAAMVLILFVAILTSVVVSGDASCGCFGSKGPPPIVVLCIDAALLACVLFFKPRTLNPSTKRSSAFMGAWIAASALAVAVTFGMPAKMQVQSQPVQSKPPITKDAAHSTLQTAPPASADTSAWPKPPEQLQPYYMPQVEQWVGKPLRSQPLAALIQQPIPANLEQGRWIVMFFRKDCDHCHEVLEKHFMVNLPAPTLLVSIPDTNPASDLPNPCSSCVETSFIKGPEYVVGTPILMSLENGVIKRVCVDSENRESLEATLKFQ